MHVFGASHTPEYVIGGRSTSFRKTTNGKRIAPTAMLNTRFGRMVAELEDPEKDSKNTSKENSKENSKKGDAVAVSVDSIEQAENAVLLQEVGSSSQLRRKTSQKGSKVDGDTHPPRRPRSELSQVLSMTRGSSRKGTTEGMKKVHKLNAAAVNAPGHSTAWVPSLPPVQPLPPLPGKSTLRNQVLKRSLSEPCELDLWEQEAHAERDVEDEARRLMEEIGIMPNTEALNSSLESWGEEVLGMWGIYHALS
jgi:hypothetical protein